MKGGFWWMALLGAIVSFFVIMGVMGAILDPLPPGRFKSAGYLAAAILIAVGAAGLTAGIWIRKKKPLLSGALVGFSSVAAVFGVLTFIVGP
jgi:hypothetical protein